MRKQSQQVTEILHTHRNQARYFAVFLMLSALVISFVCSALMMPAVSMTEGNPKYDKAYTIENILSSYNLFAENDMTTHNHVVGAIAVGNNYTGESTSGDAAKAPSYAKNIVKSPGYSCGAYLDAADRETLAFYYQTVADGVTLGTNYEQVPESYIDFTQAFANIRAWSQGKAKETGPHVWVVQASDLTQTYNHKSGKKLDIDVSTVKATDIIIPKNIYDQIGLINFVSSAGATNAEITEALARNGYTITIPGVKEVMLRFDYSYSDKRICINGQSIENSFKKLSGAIHGGEANLDGTNLIWNFPDATDVEVNHLSGHVVAPNATAKICCCGDGSISTGGNFEGNVIAKNIFTGGEAHFYSYYGLKSTKPMDVSVEKQWVGDPEGTSHAGDSIRVQLYKSQDAVEDLSQLTDAQKSGEPITLNSTNNWAYKWENVEKGYFYYVKELDVPDGYTVSYSGNGLSTIGMIVISNANNATVVTTTTTTGTVAATTTASGESTTTTQTTTTTTVQTTTTTAPATTTTAAATTTQGIRIGIHKVWSDLATNSHDSDTVVVEIHRSTNPADVPDQMKITTTAVTTTATATVTTTGKSPPSGADQSGSVQYDGTQLIIPINGETDTMVESIVFSVSDGPYAPWSELTVEMLNSSDNINNWSKRAGFKIKSQSASDALTYADANHCTVTVSGSTFTITGIAESINRIHFRNGANLRISIDYTITYASGTSGQGMDSIKPVLAAKGSFSPTWVQNLEIRKDTGWTAAAENLPATDADGNPYYYWAVEKDFSGYDASYLYENSPGDKYITGKDGSITVCNTPSKTTGVVMPSTGGSGTFTYRLIGISLMTAAAGLFVLRRQKQFRS